MKVRRPPEVFLAYNIIKLTSESAFNSNTTTTMTIYSCLNINGRASCMMASCAQLGKNLNVLRRTGSHGQRHQLSSVGRSVLRETTPLKSTQSLRLSFW